MSKILNNLLGMYKQAKLNKKAEEDVEDIEKWFSVKLNNDQAKEFTKLLTENNIKNKSKKEGEEIRVSFFLLPSSIGVAQGLLVATLSKFPDKQASTIKRAEEDLIQVGWDLISGDEDMIKSLAEDTGRRINKNFWDKINKDIVKVENWFLTEGYKQYFTKVRDEGHGSDDGLGGAAWMTKQQMQDFISQAEKYDENSYALFESMGTLDINISHDDAVVFHLYIYIDDKDLDKLGIEAKKVSKNKKLSSKKTTLTKKAGNEMFSQAVLSDKQFKELANSAKDMGDEIWGILDGKIVHIIAIISNENKVLYIEPYYGEEETKETYENADEAFDADFFTLELLPGDDTYADIGFVAKESSKNKKLTKKADEDLNKEYKLLGNGLPTFDFNKKIIDFLDGINKKFDKFCVKIYGKIVCFNEIKDKKLITDKGEEFDYRDFGSSLLLKIYNKLKDNKQSSKTKAVRKQAKYEETVQGDEKVKDSAKSFGYDIKFAGHYGKWIYYYLIDEKGNIIRDDKEYQKVYDEMKKRIDDDIDINNYAFAKGLIEEVDGELMRVPTIVISEYTLLSNHKDREENTGLEEFKRDFNLSSSTKKQAVLQESENGLGYVLPNGSVVYPGDEKYLQSELKGDKELLEKTKSEIVRLEKEMEEIKKEYPEVDLSKYPDSILFKLDRELKLKETIELSIETIEDILNAFKNKKMGKQATIKHENGVYNVYSESGKCLGKGYKTKEEAEKRLKQVEYFKHKDKKAAIGYDFYGPKIMPDEAEGTFRIKYYGGPGKIDYLRKSKNGKYHWVEQTHFDYNNDKPFETTDYELAKKLVDQFGGEIETVANKQTKNKRTSLKVEYFKHKKASVIKKAKNLSEIDGDTEFMSDLEIGNGMPYNSDDYDYFEVYKIHAKNPKDTYNNKYVVVSDDGSILAVREKEEDIIEITYDDMLQELRWRRLSNRKTQPNKRTSLKQIEYFKNKKANKEDTYEEWGVLCNDLDEEWFDSETGAKIFFNKVKNKVDQVVHKVYDISNEEPEEIQVDVLYDKDRKINKLTMKTSLKQVVISKMAKSLKDIPDSVKKNILSDLVYVILTGKGSFAYKTVAKKLEAIIKELGYGDKLKANEDGSLPTMEIVELISKEPKAMELAGKFANITRAF